MSACLIPVAPEFEDPVVTNFAPQLVDPDPPFMWQGPAEYLPGPNTWGKEFRVSVSDPNLSDALHLKAFAPVASLGMFQVHNQNWQPLPPTSNDPVRGSTSFEVNCDFLPVGPSVHRVTVFLGDRDLAIEQDSPRVANGGLADVGGWVLEVQCPQR